MKKATFGFLAAVATVALAVPAGAQTPMNGAGATFPAPIYTKWFSEYHKIHGNVQVNYQAIGSGGGIRQITERTVDFGASDGPMTAEQIQAAPGILHFPTVMGAVVPIYNIPGVDTELKFTGPVLADNFMGKITKWNDRAITALNPGVRLPDSDIAVVHRADGSKAKPGTGLGLAIVKHLAALHHARVLVGGEPGGGAVFRVSFPPPSRSGAGPVQAAAGGQAVRCRPSLLAKRGERDRGARDRIVSGRRPVRSSIHDFVRRPPCARFSAKAWFPSRGPCRA